MEPLSKNQSPISPPTNSEDILKSTFLQELESLAAHCATVVSMIQDSPHLLKIPSLPDHVPANHSQPPKQPVKTLKKALPTNGISGHTCTDSSKNTIKSMTTLFGTLLVNRCRKRRDNDGITSLYNLRWKKRVISPTQYHWAHIASTRRHTKDSDSTGQRIDGWKTVRKSDGESGPTKIHINNTGTAVRKSDTTGTEYGLSLVSLVQVAGWPTALASETGEKMETVLARKAGQMKLGTLVQRAGWPTTVGRDYKDGTSESADIQVNEKGRIVRKSLTTGREHGIQLGKIVFATHWKDHTQIMITAPEPTNKYDTCTVQILSGDRYQLNPAMCRWLMQIPKSWDVAAQSAAMAMQSSSR